MTCKNMTLIRKIAPTIFNAYNAFFDDIFELFINELLTEEVHYLKVRTGDNIFTPDNEIHATYFPVKTRLIVSSKFPRDQVTYEKDTVRVPFVTLENIQDMLAKYAENK